jgi:uracil-DNA glycosylase
MVKLRIIVALGRIAHESVLAALDIKRSQAAFKHACRHSVGALTLFDSYHCSRYNTNTGVLTTEMFHAVFAALRRHLDKS